MTYYGRTVNEHVDLTLALVIEGIPVALVERAIPGSPAGLGGRTQHVCVTRVEEGEAALDYVERRENAATLDIEALDESGVLDALFAAGTRAVGWVSTDDADDPADTVVYVDSDDPYTVGQTVYVGAESMIVNTIDPAPYLDVTRGAWGSTAQTGMTGTSSDGDSIYVVPPFWRGRRAWLYGYVEGVETLLGTYIVDESPRHAGDRRWALRLAGIVQEYWERSVGQGVQDTATTGDAAAWTDGAPSALEIAMHYAKAFRTSPSGWPTYVMATHESMGASIAELLDADDIAGTITVAREGAFGTRGLIGMPLVGPTTGWVFRQIGVIQSPGASSILVALLSDEGQALSGGDFLPGRPPSTTHDAGWRLGAGFKVSEVEVAAFDAVEAVPPMTIIIDGERKVTDLLREWCILTGTAVVTTVDGKIKPITLAAPRAAGARTLGADDVIPEGPVSVEHDESSVFPLLTIRAGYSPITGEFHDEINLIDVELTKRYRRTPQRREIEIRGIDVRRPGPPAAATDGWRHPTRMQPADMVTLISDAMRGDGALARRFVQLSLTHEHLDLRIGDVVRIGSDLPDAYDLPDFRGGDIAGATCRVVARRPRYDQARVDVRLEVLDRLLHVCPAAVIASVSGSQITLATTGPEVSGPSPTDDYFVGASVTLHDRSTPANIDGTTIASIDSPTQMTLADPPGFTVQTGVDYVVLNPATSVDGTTASGYTLAEFATIAGDDGKSNTGAAATNEPRWR